MTKKIRLIIVVSAIVLAGLAFYGGTLYGKNSSSKTFPSNFSAGAGARGNRMRVPTGADFMSGQIIGKDDRSITLKLRDGNTKIIFYSESTDVGKFVKGATGDLNNDETVMVTGKTNPDGSLTATNIQIRPEPPVPLPTPASPK